MKTRVEEAERRHRSGYNCAQAVACTYCDLAGMDETTMFKLSEGFGGGMGSMAGTCGAASGACLLAGLKNSTGHLDHPDSKASTYRLSAAIMNAFEKDCGSCICRDLKGIGTGHALCSCPDCVRKGAELVETVIFPERFRSAD
jgi:C_GCAxxG_C_C family probable redox protein